MLAPHRATMATDPGCLGIPAGDLLLTIELLTEPGQVFGSSFYGVHCGCKGQGGDASISPSK